MDALTELSLQMIYFLQSLGQGFIGVMKVFTSMGSEEFYLFVAPAIYWCLDTRVGLRMGLGLMVSSCVYSVLKISLATPRPYWIEPGVIAYSSELSFGFPSGHAQNAVVVWGILASWFKKRGLWVGALALMLLIGISRMAMGVHYLHDVLGGWAIGALLLWAFIKTENRILAWLKRYNPAELILVALGTSMVMVLAGALARLALGNWVIPEQWLDLVAAKGAGEIDPLALSGLISNAGVFFGLASGAVWLEQMGGMDASGSLTKRLLRFLIGLVGVYLIWAGLGQMFPRSETLLSYMLRFVRYALVGLWVAGLAPLIFRRLGLAASES